MKALIGFSGFVGSVLLKQSNFDLLYRSTNISGIKGQFFDTVVCAGAPAQKWVANRDPKADRQNIELLIEHLRTIQCKMFILISTIDVFNDARCVDEESLVDEQDLHSYGLHRRMLEKFVESHFPHSLVVRLPGLVGPGLRKNVIFDFLNENNLHRIESRSIFQFYPMVNLWYDIQMALNAGLKLVHFSTNPISVADVSKKCFGKNFQQTLANMPVEYDMRSCHARVFGGTGPYLYSLRETIQAIRAYAQSEPLVSEIKLGMKP